jgi:predicted PurR-regulated permease PerM
VAGRAFGAIGGVLGGASGIATILILTFYFLLDAERLADAWVHLVPRDRRDQARAIARRVGEKVSAWLVGQLIVGALIGVTAGVALMLLGVRFFYVLALVTAVGEFIPFIGPFIAGTIASLIAATTSLQLAVVTAAYYVVQQLVEVNIVVPRIMGHQVGLDGAAVIIAVLLGHALLGVVGAILAVPTAAILQATVQEVAARPE